MENYLFEICANSVESCLAAQAGGAHRVELCAGIPEGGTTPSYGDIVTARDVLTSTRLHVIIRPRGGDFLYSPLEQRIMLKDIENARQLGADGVVFGCLTSEGDVDLPLMERLMEASEGMSVTFHRAFDVCRNPLKALEDIIALGCNRILTSGQQPNAEQGIPFLKELQKKAGERITLLAGCGVNEKNIARIAHETGIHEFHFSAREEVTSCMQYRNEAVSMGGTVHISEYSRPVTTAERVTRTIKALTNL
ncbi:copper homeostasis protein CutC [Bacteroidales bacterium SW292]|uniref:copper homeostasis protein CutC n=1 Tax=Mediterranea sp. An20 TaxID=1965586 RepID=UPI000B3A5E69|nr:copper homeostasis protein CutC [Mediterranea sp. An20]MBW9202131.1 copper homeostasis protein CutC [Bacteroidales bacterium SW292]OUP10283.1 copper homeostasis protein CutC [Mediterranea sp. An20]